MVGLDLLSLLGTLLDIAGTVFILTGLWMLFKSTLPTIRPEILSWLRVDLSRSYFIERVVYHHHRVTGVILISTAAYWLWHLSALAACRKFLVLTWAYLGQLGQSGQLSALAFSGLALMILVIGMLLLVRPSLLKPLETRVNRWISLLSITQLTKTLPPCKLNLLKSRAPRIMGLISLTIGFVSIWVAQVLLRN